MTDGSTPRRRARTGGRVAAALTVFTLLAGLAACTDDPEPGAGGITGENLLAVGKGLPGDPARAAEQLVGTIHGADPKQAEVATAELLRRSGFVIVTGAGSVVAVPDRLALRDAHVYAELIPVLTRSTRDGYLYTVGQLSEVLHGIGATGKPPTFGQITGEVASWGKRPGADPIFQTAASAVRALSILRGQVLHAEADAESTYLDPLQNLLLLGHATSRIGLVKEGSAGTAPRALGLVDRLLGTGVAHAQEVGGCAELNAIFDEMSQLEKLGKDIGKDIYMDSLTNAAGERLGGAIEKADEAWGKISTLLSSAMLLLGARIDLVSDKPSTHFKHKPGSRAEHVLLTATASWDLGIAATRLECFSLAGLDTPEPGPLKGYRVWWKDHQPGSSAQKEVKFLGVARADNQKVIDGSLTDGNGKTTLELKPHVENPAGTGAELEGRAVYVASLDKENFPFELSDLYNLSKGGALGKAYDLVIELLTKSMLPSKAVGIDVTYHGSDVVVARGKRTTGFPGFFTLNGVTVDLVSCEGTKGPYKGIAGYQDVESGFILDTGGDVTGIDVPSQAAGQLNEIELTLPKLPGSAKTIAVKSDGGEEFLTVELEVDTDEKFYSPAFVYIPSRAGIGRPVGEVEILVGGKTWMFGDLSWPVYRVKADAGCEQVEYYLDES